MLNTIVKKHYSYSRNIYKNKRAGLIRNHENVSCLEPCFNCNCGRQKKHFNHLKINQRSLFSRKTVKKFKKRLWFNPKF